MSKPRHAKKKRGPYRQPVVSTPLPAPWWRVPWIYAVGLFIVGVLIYLPALSGPFFLDDDDLLAAFSPVRSDDLSIPMGSGRPLLILSFRLNYWISGFESSFGFHLVNVLLHALNAFLLWRFLAALVALPAVGDKLAGGSRKVLVYGVPALFLTSPIQTESVAYISSRSEVLGATFFLAALWVFVSPWREKHPWRTAVLVVLLLGASWGCKQDKITLLPVILILDYLLLAGLDWRKMRDNIATYSLCAAAGVIGFFVLIKPFLFAVSAGFNLPWQPYLFTQFRVIFFYLKLLAFPFGLNIDWDITLSETLWENFSWLALAALGGLLWAATRFRRTLPLVSFAILFYLVTLAPTTSFFPLLDFAAERRLYLPSIGFFIMVTILPARWSGPSANKAIAALAILTLVYSAGTFQRSRLWGDDLAMWHDTAEKSPNKYRPLTWLGKLYDARGMTDRAIQYWERAEKLADPGTKEHGYLLVNLGVAAVRKKNYAGAVEHYQDALKTIPKDRQPVVWANLAVAQLRLGRKQQGWQSFQTAGTLGGGSEVNLLFGQELFQHGRYHAAVEAFERVLHARPEDATARRNLAIARQKAAQQR